MPQPDRVVASDWGYECPQISPADLVDAFKRETEQALAAFEALPEEPEPCNDKPGYSRVAVVIPLSRPLFDQLMNGPNGYRAHYSAGVEVGERFNQQLVDAVAMAIVDCEDLYSDRFTRQVCLSSLSGRFTKLWYSKQLTDPSGQRYLEKLPEVIRVPRWTKYWHERPKPRKGLLAPVPDDTSVLLNGSFVRNSDEPYEQKPGRSMQLFETGWT